MLAVYVTIQRNIERQIDPPPSTTADFDVSVPQPQEIAKNVQL